MRRLVKEMDLYKNLTRLVGDEVRISIALDDAEEATMVIGDEIWIKERSEDPDLRLTMKKGVFNEIIKGNADFGALISRAKMSDIRPINFQVLKPDRVSAAFETLKVLMTTFFTPGTVKVKDLKAALAGEAHGAHPIPLVYWDGIRFAWYVVKKGEVLNEEGERDPYPQILVILRGRGVVTIDENLLELRPNTAIYVPVNSIHQIRAEKDVEALWFAWNAPP